MALPEGLSPEQRLQRLEREIDAQHRMFGGIDSFEVLTSARVYVFPEGNAPSRQTGGSEGFDAHARAIVDPLSKPTADSPLRRPLADFMKRGKSWIDRVDPSLQEWAVDDESDERKYAVNLPYGHRLMVGLGIATGMEFPMFIWVAPRSGFAMRGITVANSPGTIDSDYRGEGGALVENLSTDKSDFQISHNMRIAQLLFAAALIPDLDFVEDHDRLGTTERGAGGFGSTGTR